MKIVIKILVLCITSILITSCDRNTTLRTTIDYNNNRVSSENIISKKEVEFLKSNIKDSRHGAIGYDRDSYMKTIKNSSKSQLYFGFCLEGINKYLEYYYILDKKNRVIAWKFTHCDKRKIDFNDKTSYQQCFKNSKVIKEKNNIYRIGVNRTILKKYGYKKDDYNTKHVDDIHIVTDILDADGRCKNGIKKILKKEYWGFEHNVRYYVKCNKE